VTLRKDIMKIREVVAGNEGAEAGLQATHKHTLDDRAGFMPRRIWPPPFHLYTAYD
jgi:hypothetical protein